MHRRAVQDARSDAVEVVPPLLLEGQQQEAAEHRGVVGPVGHAVGGEGETTPHLRFLAIEGSGTVEKVPTSLRRFLNPFEGSRRL